MFGSSPLGHDQRHSPGSTVPIGDSTHHHEITKNKTLIGPIHVGTVFMTSTPRTPSNKANKETSDKSSSKIGRLLPKDSKSSSESSTNKNSKSPGDPPASTGDSTLEGGSRGDSQDFPQGGSSPTNKASLSTVDPSLTTGEDQGDLSKTVIKLPQGAANFNWKMVQGAEGQLTLVPFSVAMSSTSVVSPSPATIPLVDDTSKILADRGSTSPKRGSSRHPSLDSAILVPQRDTRRDPPRLTSLLDTAIVIDTILIVDPLGLPARRALLLVLVTLDALTS
ncbi:hypothetical protein FOL46_003341, partial [Perkinsus olseni]